ncbi:amino acid transporter AVT1B-like [Homarus americanus]|uniref:amino acid transporter AVT1B-like n=1 Tax=Homarus americanus TaxID=6706 RepID=UPI001C480F89|nr:amino acid transporter AVT1B-like [Homarus americanus]
MQERGSSSLPGNIKELGISPSAGGPRNGLGFAMTTFFLVAQMAGAGFLSLPKAVANCGWIGLVMMVVFCTGVGFSGTRLGACWVILEERWPMCYRDSCRQPYMEIADRALGIHGRRLALACVLITLVGGTTVFLILIASFMKVLVTSVSICEWVLITAALVMPFTWLGTPKDFWQASVLAVTTTTIACVVILVEIILEKDLHPNPVYQNPTVSSFALGFGAILFAFGGASVFPTIQNDMGNRKLFIKAVVVAFAVLLALYLPVATTGYAVQGMDVKDNILLSVESSKGIVKAALMMEVLNLLGTYIITYNPIGQMFEEVFSIENKFGWKRCVLRSAILIFEVVVGLAVPDFGKILNLIGGSTVTLCSFILPPLMYMKLVDDKSNPSWPQRQIELWERMLLWIIVGVGVVGGIASTISALIAILSPDSFSTSCFSDFYF